MSKISPHNLVAQANRMVEGYYSSTRNEKLLLNAMASLINPKDQDFPDFCVTVDDLCKILEINRKAAIREFKKISEKLLKKIIVIDSKEYGWMAFQWVSKATLKDGVVTLRFHDELKPYLLELKKEGNFTQYRLGSTTGFRSIYSIRIYELLKLHDGKKMYSFEFSIDDFRQMVLGQESKSYPAFKMFRVRVLNTAQKELGEKDPNTGLYKSDLGFTLETRRTGRKISHLIFTIKKQPTQPLLKPSESGKNKATTDTAPQIILDYEFYGLDRLIVQPFLKQRGEQALTNTLEKFKRDKKRGAIQKNEQGYLRKLLKTNAGQATDSEKAETKKEKQQTIAKQAQQKAQQREALISEYKQAFGDSERKRFIELLSSEQLEQVKNSLLQEHKGNSFVIEQIKKGDLLSPFVMASLNDLIPDFYQQEENYINEKLTKAN